MAKLTIRHGDRAIDLPTPQKIELNFGLPVRSEPLEAFESTEETVQTFTITIPVSLFRQNHTK